MSGAMMTVHLTIIQSLPIFSRPHSGEIGKANAACDCCVRKWSDAYVSWALDISDRYELLEVQEIYRCLRKAISFLLQRREVQLSYGPLACQLTLEEPIMLSDINHRYNMDELEDHYARLNWALEGLDRVWDNLAIVQASLVLFTVHEDGGVNLGPSCRHGKP
ncbi:hypothetical protein NHQ30_011371 [Ciborinia camelliae]|nr:hypothetical protein NHQ30_011371 [Ciborinia camelliae]